MIKKRIMKLRIRQASKRGWIEVPEGGVFDISYPTSKSRRGRVQDGGLVCPALTCEPIICVYEGMEQEPINTDREGNAYTITARYPILNAANVMGGNHFPKTAVSEHDENYPPLPDNLDLSKMDYRIRKLTPRETGRLMGLDDEDIDKMISTGISKSALYKLHGNSIVVDVLYYIFRQMFFPEKVKGENVQLKLF
jgi:DNA (cytosine-5)-methyltransferase 1